MIAAHDTHTPSPQDFSGIEQTLWSSEPAVTGLLVTLSLLLAFVSFALTSQATAGVWMIGVACYLGILARLVQADTHAKK